MRTNHPSRLLADLACEASGTAWAELDLRYRSALIGFAERLGASRVDAEEITQDSFAAFVGACRMGRYDPTAGSLSGWLFALVRDRVRQNWRRNAVRNVARGESALAEVEDDAHLSEVWDAEWRGAILREGLRRLREESGLAPRSLAAFEGVALEGRDAGVLASELGMTVNAVYQAKFRALERLRVIVVALECADHVAAAGEARP
mgnify:CR=1 FL=1